MTTNENLAIPEDAEPFLKYLSEKPRSPKEIAAFLSAFKKVNFPYTPGATK